jgi:hypothetical protein
LLPSQLVDVSGYSDDPDAKEDRMRSLARRARGGFGFPTPNDLQFTPDAPLFVYDVVSGAVDALCETYRVIATEEPAGWRVNLLMDVETPGVSVRSLLSRDGRIELRNRTRGNVFVRIPGWVPAPTVALEVAGRRLEPRFAGPHLVVDQEIGDQRVTITFPMRDETTVESIVYQRFTIDWRGDQIVAMCPPAIPHAEMEPLPRPSLPMFPACR